MIEKPTILTSSDLVLAFLSHVQGQDIEYLSGNNPFFVKINGRDSYVYIKNLSPAHLSNNNPDIWRIQLPVKEEFDNIKNSAAPFFLFGYDAENKVYTSWNPYWCKQRLNVGKSVSLYSRYSLQKRVAETGIIEQIELNNDGDVVCIPASQIYQYIKSVKDYYPEETMFIAKGSKIQKRIQEKSNPGLFNEDDARNLIYDYNVDEFGKLQALDMSIIPILYPYYKGRDYPDYEKMIEIASGHYPSDVTDKMNPVDWIKLFDDTTWCVKNKRRNRKPNLNLRITEQNGNVIQNTSPLDTFIRVIENSYPDLLLEINFGIPVISKNRLPDFPGGTKRSQRKISGGFYLSTNFDTTTKAKILQRISDELELGWRIDILPG